MRKGMSQRNLVNEIGKEEHDWPLSGVGAFFPQIHPARVCEDTWFDEWYPDLNNNLWMVNLGPLSDFSVLTQVWNWVFTPLIKDFIKFEVSNFCFMKKNPT